jgi:hypothetical protein
MGKGVEAKSYDQQTRQARWGFCLLLICCDFFSTLQIQSVPLTLIYSEREEEEERICHAMKRHYDLTSRGVSSKLV